MKALRANGQFLSAMILILMTVLIQSCDIKEPTAPNWDVLLNLPIASKSYTLLGIIEEKSTVIQHYSGGVNQNLLYYSDSQQMDKIMLGDKLKPDPNSVAVPGTISISADSIQTDIDLSWIGQQVTPGMQIIMPDVSETGVSSNFSLADQFQTVKIASGFIDLTITNHFPSPVKITLRNVIIKNQGSGEIAAQSLSPVEIQPLQSSSRNSIPIIQGITVKNELSLQAIISATGSNGQPVTLPANSLTIKAKFHDLKVAEYTGRLKPTLFENTRNAVGLDVKDIQQKFHFQQINLKNPKIELHLRLTADVEFGINGRIEAGNSIGQKSIMNLNSRTLNKTLITQSDSVLIFNADSLSNFFKKLSQFPDSLIVYVGGVVNPNNKLISVKWSDQLTVSSKMEFPFEFGLSGAEYSDSVKVDFSNDDRDKIKDVNSLGASITVTNGIPASLSFTGRLYDHNNKFLTYFPPKYPDQDTVISVSGASVDAEGNVISNTVQNVNVNTAKADIDKIAGAYYMRVKIKFNTAGSGNQTVRFNSNNIIRFLASGSINYHINPEGNKK